MLSFLLYFLRQVCASRVARIPFCQLDCHVARGKWQVANGRRQAAGGVWQANFQINFYFSRTIVLVCLSARLSVLFVRAIRPFFVIAHTRNASSASESQKAECQDIYEFIAISIIALSCHFVVPLQIKLSICLWHERDFLQCDRQAEGKVL